MADFYNNLARVNALAERMPGFVWRLADAGGDSAMALHWPGDPTMNVNMSIWESPEALARFVFQTVHRNIYARKHDFFETPDRPMFVLWWVEPGHISRRWRRPRTASTTIARTGPATTPSAGPTSPEAKALMERARAWPAPPPGNLASGHVHSLP